MKAIIFYFLLFLLVNQNANGTEVIPATVKDLEIGGDAKSVGSILLRETNSNDFKNTSEELKYSIKLPDGIVFEDLENDEEYLIQTSGGGLIGVRSYLSDNNSKFTFEYKYDGESNSEIATLTIQNLKVKAISVGNGNAVRVSNPEEDADLGVSSGAIHILITSILPAPYLKSGFIPPIYSDCDVSVLKNKIILEGKSNFVSWYHYPQVNDPINEKSLTPDPSELFKNPKIGPNTVYACVDNDGFGANRSHFTPITLTVIPAPEITIHGLPITNFCETTDEEFELVADLNGGTFKLLKDGKEIETSPNPYTYKPGANEAGSYDIIYEYTSPAGCKVSATKEVDVIPSIPEEPKWNPDSTSLIISDFPNGYDLIYGVNDKIDIAENASEGTYSFHGPGVIGNRFFPGAVTGQPPYDIIYTKKSTEVCDSVVTQSFYVHDSQNSGSGDFIDHVELLGDHNLPFCTSYDTQYVEIRRMPVYEAGRDEARNLDYIKGEKFFIKNVEVDDSSATVVDISSYKDSSDVYTLALIPSKANQNTISITVDFLSVAYYQEKLDGSASYTMMSIRPVPYTKTLEFPVLPTPETQISSMSSSFCTGSDQPVTFISTPHGGQTEYYKIEDDQKNFLDEVTQQGNPTPGELGVGNYRVFYTKSNSKCSATDSADFTVNPAPDATFNTNTSYCLGDTITFEAPDNPGAVYEWNLGDNTQSTQQFFEYVYSEPDRYEVKLSVEQGEGESKCTSEQSSQIIVGAIPSAGFNFKSVCENDTTFFINKSAIISNIAEDTLKAFSWQIDNDKETEYSTKNPSHNFSQSGVYQVSLKVNSTYNCTDSIAKSVSIFEKYTVTATNSYQDGFESAAEWISTKENNMGRYSSWSRMQPAIGNSSNSGSGNAWVTNNSESGSYSSNEKSWVESPCFVIDNLQRPMISLKTFTDLEPGVDGAVLEYVIDDKTTPDSSFNWKTLGSVNSGENWYNYRGINSSPGDQDADWYGWSGYRDSSSWIVSKLGLDEIKSDPDFQNGDYVRFRIAFASNEANPQFRDFSGFAFDDVFIGERRRLVLMEHFTNINTPFSTDEKIDDFIEASNEVVKLQYHINFPQDDPFYKENRADASARALLYGINTPQRCVLDGVFQEDSSFATGWVEETYSRRTLANTAFSIDLSTAAEPEGLKVTTTVRSRESDREIKGPFLIQTAIVQKERIYEGRVYTNVVEKLLPNAAGVRLASINSTDTTVSVYWKPTSPVADPENYMLIVFIQDENTKEVYQSAYTSLDLEKLQKLKVTQPGERTQADPHNLQTLTLYPNPTRGSYNLLFKEHLTESHNWRMINIFGETVGEGTLKKSQNSWSFNPSYPTGLYTLQVFKDGKVTVSRRLQVVK